MILIGNLYPNYNSVVSIQFEFFNSLIFVGTDMGSSLRPGQAKEVEHNDITS